MPRRAVQPVTGRSTVLVVDDDQAICDLTSVLLRGQGYECEVASTPAEARDTLRRRPISLCLCDLYLGTESGFELAQEIAELAPDVALVMMSGSDDAAVVEQALVLGAYDYLLKPFGRASWRSPSRTPSTAANSSRSPESSGAGWRMPSRCRARRRSTGSRVPWSSGIRRRVATSSG